MFFKTGDLSNFGIFTRKHQCWNIFLIKSVWSSLLKETSAFLFSCEYCEGIFKNNFCYITNVTSFDLTQLYILWMINEIIAFSSCATFWYQLDYADGWLENSLGETSSDFLGNFCPTGIISTAIFSD